MVLCKFYQTGSCRFGTKCVNEHFDVKALVKSDIEAAISGKQWPLSCFGPFKDKPCIPNFIEDQSFEEIRLLCYESKRQNYFETFQQQFAKEALEATNKLKMLLQLTPDVIDVVINVYDASSDVSAAGVMGSAKVAAKNTSAGGGNPFGLSATATAGNSLFSKPQTAAVGGAVGANVFSSGFGNAAVSANVSGGAIGGGSIFGGGNSNNTQQSSIFGQQAGTTAANPTNSIFGNSQGSLFAPQQQQQNQSTAMNASGGGLFAQAAQQMQAPPSGLFAQAASAFTPQLNNPFSQQQQQQQQPSSGIFGQAAQAMQAAPVTMGGGGLFANAIAQSQNLFTQNQPNAATTATNMFAQPSQQQALPPTGFFQQAMQQQQQQQPQSAFMQQPQAPVQMQSASASSSAAMSGIYSRMEDLSAEDIEAFRADSFMPGKIPRMPPARELIN